MAFNRALRASGVAASAAVIAATVGVPAAHADTGPAAVQHLVVIYQENHSFDNLFGLWGDVNGQPLRTAAHDPAYAAKQTQTNQAGTAYPCLLVTDENMTTTSDTQSYLDGSTGHPGPLAPSCNNTGTPNTATPKSAPFNSAFANAPFRIDSYVAPTDPTCSIPTVFAPTNGIDKRDTTAPAKVLPGGCTRDIVHRFYQEQYQIDGGKQDHYSVGSDAAGLTQGYYDTTALPIYQYLHKTGAYAADTPPNYVVEDNFFQGAFGGSYLNHQALISAQAPKWPTATVPAANQSQVDANGFPNAGYPLYTATGTVKDNQVTQPSSSGDAYGTCVVGTGGVTPPAGTLCGNYTVNTLQPATQPSSNTAQIGANFDDAPYTPAGSSVTTRPTRTNDTVGDLLSDKGVTWKWYSGGWDNAAGNDGFDANHPLGAGWTNYDGSGNVPAAGASCTDPNVTTGKKLPYCPDGLFQFHHQPFAFYANYAENTPGRLDHLSDVEQFKLDASGTSKTVNGHTFSAQPLPAVSFIKTIGEENEHPGYGSESNGSTALVNLIKTIENGPYANNTEVVVTYDEFGGQWDHVAPPGPGANRTPGAYDAFGPGTRIPAIVLGKVVPSSGVDDQEHDTTSIITTIENQFAGGTRLQGSAPVFQGSSFQQTSLRDARDNDLSSAFVPQPGADLPEAPLAVGLPLVAIAAAGVVLARRRRRAA